MFPPLPGNTLAFQAKLKTQEPKPLKHRPHPRLLATRIKITTGFKKHIKNAETDILSNEATQHTTQAASLQR